LKVGDRVDLSGPYGQFFVRTSQSGDLIFIAGGSGLSSPQSMILDLLEAGDSRQIVLFQGARNRAELYNRELFEALAREHANFTYVPALSQAVEDSDWTGFRATCMTPRSSISTVASTTARLTCAAAGDDRFGHYLPDAGAVVRTRHLHGALLQRRRRQ
jgi:Na+-transporting NADH:ubiquinone oxidoreductase subunit NqrF